MKRGGQRPGCVGTRSARPISAFSFQVSAFKCGPMRYPALLLLAFLSLVSLRLASAEKPSVPTDAPVTYESFGAKGDGVADDLPAIVEAHAFANEHGLPVKTKPDATYNLGRRAI